MAAVGPARATADPVDGVAAVRPPPHRLTRIWADADGASHFDDIELPVTVHPAEHGVPELWQSEGLATEQMHFVAVRTASFAPDWHCAPRRQVVVFLTGWARLEVSDGEVRTIPAGGAVLVEDHHGRGHVTTHEDGDQQVLVIPLADPPRG